MGYSKRQFIEAAGEEIGMASYIYDLSPETLNAWCLRLDAMMADWNGRGIRLGYPIPASPDDSDLDAQTVVPNWANEAVILNLALKISPMQGKVVPPETKTNAFKAFTTVAGRSAVPPQMQLPGTMPSGAGNRPFRTGSNYIIPPVDQEVALPEDDVTFSN